MFSASATAATAAKAGSQRYSPRSPRPCRGSKAPCGSTISFARKYTPLQRQPFRSARVPATGAAASGAMPPAASTQQQAARGYQVLQCMQQMPERYKGALLDQFGVLHDGEKPYPGAIEAVAQLAARGMRLLIISNSSRRSAGALQNLERMGFDPKCFAGVVTSGEVTHRHITRRPDAWWAALGSRCLHFTWAARGAISLQGLGVEVTTDPQQADFILAHGTEALGTSVDGSAATPTSLDAMRELLQQCAERGGIPMVVANPDVVTVAGSELRVMPGTLARHYASLGGQVVLMGKPAAVIYEAALKMLQLPASLVVAVGDSLEHDIGGAQAAGVDSLFVLGGIHRQDVQLQAAQDATAGCADSGKSTGSHGKGGVEGSSRYTFSGQQLLQACAAHGVALPNHIVPYFSWQP